eukprot:s1228_g5.t1
MIRIRACFSHRHSVRLPRCGPSDCAPATACLVTIPEIAATAVTEPPGTALADQVPAEQAHHEKIAVTEAGADETMKSVTGATTGMQAATAPEEMIAGTTATALGSTVEGPAEVTAATAEVTVAMCAALATIVIAALVERPDRVEGQAATGAEIGSVRSVAATILPVETNVSMSGFSVDKAPDTSSEKFMKLQFPFPLECAAVEVEQPGLLLFEEVQCEIPQPCLATIPVIGATAELLTEHRGTAHADRAPVELAPHEKTAVIEAEDETTTSGTEATTTEMQTVAPGEEMTGGTTTAIALGNMAEGPVDVTAVTAEATAAMTVGLATTVIAALDGPSDQVEGPAATGAEIGNVRSVAATILLAEMSASSGYATEVLETEELRSLGSGAVPAGILVVALLQEAQSQPFASGQGEHAHVAALAESHSSEISEKVGRGDRICLRAMSSEGVTVTGAEESSTGANPKPPEPRIPCGWKEYPVFESFDDYELDENLLRGIYSYGFEKPSAIQQRGIKPILDGRDTIGQAQSGTGKTATFVIGSLQRINYGERHTQDHLLHRMSFRLIAPRTYCKMKGYALILAPTRELANQIYKVALALGDYLKVRAHACIGGRRVLKFLWTLKAL